MNDLIISVVQSGLALMILKLVYTTGRILQKVDSKLDEHERRIVKLEEKL